MLLSVFMMYLPQGTLCSVSICKINHHVFLKVQDQGNVVLTCVVFIEKQEICVSMEKKTSHFVQN